MKFLLKNDLFFKNSKKIIVMFLLLVCLQGCSNQKESEDKNNINNYEVSVNILEKNFENNKNKILSILSEKNNKNYSANLYGENILQDAKNDNNEIDNFMNKLYIGSRKDSQDFLRLYIMQEFCSIFKNSKGANCKNPNSNLIIGDGEELPVYFSLFYKLKNNSEKYKDGYALTIDEENAIAIRLKLKTINEIFELWNVEEKKKDELISNLYGDSGAYKNHKYLVLDVLVNGELQKNMQNFIFFDIDFFAQNNNSCIKNNEDMCNAYFQESKIVEMENIKIQTEDKIGSDKIDNLIDDIKGEDSNFEVDNENVDYNNFDNLTKFNGNNGVARVQSNSGGGGITFRWEFDGDISAVKDASCTIFGYDSNGNIIRTSSGLNGNKNYEANKIPILQNSITIYSIEDINVFNIDGFGIYCYDSSFTWQSYSHYFDDNYFLKIPVYKGVDYMIYKNATYFMEFFDKEGNKYNNSFVKNGDNNPYKNSNNKLYIQILSKQPYITKMVVHYLRDGGSWENPDDRTSGSIDIPEGKVFFKGKIQSTNPNRLPKKTPVKVSWNQLGENYIYSLDYLNNGDYPLCKNSGVLGNSNSIEIDKSECQGQGFRVCSKHVDLDENEYENTNWGDGSICSQTVDRKNINNENINLNISGTPPKPKKKDVKEEGGNDNGEINDTETNDQCIFNNKNCCEYSENAINQTKEKEGNCNNLEGIIWDEKYDTHYNWCKSNDVTLEQVNNETKIRDDKLKECKENNQSSDSKEENSSGSQGSNWVPSQFHIVFFNARTNKATDCLYAGEIAHKTIGDMDRNTKVKCAHNRNNIEAGPNNKFIIYSLNEGKNWGDIDDRRVFREIPYIKNDDSRQSYNDAVDTSAGNAEDIQTCKTTEGNITNYCAGKNPYDVTPFCNTQYGNIDKCKWINREQRVCGTYAINVCNDGCNTQTNTCNQSSQFAGEYHLDFVEENGNIGTCKSAGDLGKNKPDVNNITCSNGKKLTEYKGYVLHKLKNKTWGDGEREIINGSF